MRASSGKSTKGLPVHDLKSRTTTAAAFPCIPTERKVVVRRSRPTRGESLLPQHHPQGKVQRKTEELKSKRNSFRPKTAKRGYYKEWRMVLLMFIGSGQPRCDEVKSVLVQAHANSIWSNLMDMTVVLETI